MLVALGVAILGGGVLLGLGLVALGRRRSWSYLLVVLALASLLSQGVVGMLAITDILGTGLHHFVEHSLDALMVALLIAAVYYARSNGRN
jgi:heme A synthase